jgi:hypothetical protein
VRAKEENAIKALEEKIATLDKWLNTEKDKISHTGLPTKSHLYDNESAKMVSSHGVVQGYNGVAAVRWGMSGGGVRGGVWRRQRNKTVGTDGGVGGKDVRRPWGTRNPR